MSDPKMSPKDVGAAKGNASPGSDNSAAGADAKDKQHKGKQSAKPMTNESPSTSKNDLAARGMSSEEAASHWKATGYKVPKSQSDNHKG